MRIDNITATQGRMKQAFNKGLGPIIENQTKKIVKEAVDKSKIHTAILTKFYPYWDKAEVQIDNNASNSKKKVLCKILHHYGGELLDFYTPNGDLIYDDNRKEKCIIPRGQLNCLVVDINSSDNEYLLLGYYNSEDLVGLNPAEQGNFKITTIGGTNQHFIKFGYDGLSIKTPYDIQTKIGELEDDIAEVSYANVDNVYGKDEVYTKSEVLRLINDLREELDLTTIEED